MDGTGYKFLACAAFATHKDCCSVFPERPYLGELHLAPQSFFEVPNHQLASLRPFRKSDPESYEA